MHVRAADGATTLVWMDSEEAIIVRWGDRATIERVRSEGCAHGHGDDDGPLASAARHGSGGALATGRAGRAGRDVLRRFTEAVASRVPGSGDVTVVGPGIRARRWSGPCAPRTGTRVAAGSSPRRPPTA